MDQTTGRQGEEQRELSPYESSKRDEKRIWRAFDDWERRESIGELRASDADDPALSKEALGLALIEQARCAGIQNQRGVERALTRPEMSDGVAGFPEIINERAMERCERGLALAQARFGYGCAVRLAEALFDQPWRASETPIKRFLINLALTPGLAGAAAAQSALNARVLESSRLWRSGGAWSKKDQLDLVLSTERLADERLCARLLIMAIKSQSPSEQSALSRLARLALGLTLGPETEASYQRAGFEAGEGFKNAKASPDRLSQEARDVFAPHFWLGAKNGRALSGARGREARESLASLAALRGEGSFLESLRLDAWLSLERASIRAFESRYPGGPDALAKAASAKMGARTTISTLLFFKNQLSEALARPSGAWARAIDFEMTLNGISAEKFVALQALFEACELKASIGSSARSKKSVRKKAL